MAFTFAAFCYILALILSAVLIFFAIYHVSISAYFLFVNNYDKFRCFYFVAVSDYQLLSVSSSQYGSALLYR